MINLPHRYSNILKQFPNGGMADTLLCEDSNLQRQVVVKSLKPGIEAHRLLDELAALSAIRSRYVVQVLDVIIDGGQPVGFVEEYLPGDELAPCDPATATTDDALRVLYPIAAGISEIHAHQRVHRDIKPENMRYDAEGHLKIFDFGLAKLETAIGTNVLYFSDGYAAPESFKKNSSGLYTFDYPLDVYAFGCVAVWLLNGGAIFPEMTGVVPSIPAGFDFNNLPVKVSPVTAGILLQCLSADPAARPTMSQCRDHLSAELLRDRHKMMLTSKSGQAILSSSQRSGTIKGNGSSISVNYDGLHFSVSSVTGVVAINNAAAVVGQILTGSTVIVLRQAGSWALSVTCDVSHPEVVL
ncbi:serine/threonine-protein kinase [Sphingopyxis sp. LARHCG72]